MEKTKKKKKEKDIYKMQAWEKAIRKGTGCVIGLQRGKMNELFGTQLLLNTGKLGALEPFNLCYMW